MITCLRSMGFLSWVQDFTIAVHSIVRHLRVESSALHLRPDTCDPRHGCFFELGHRVSKGAPHAGREGRASPYF